MPPCSKRAQRPPDRLKRLSRGMRRVMPQGRVDAMPQVTLLLQRTDEDSRWVCRATLVPWSSTASGLKLRPGCWYLPRRVPCKPRRIRGSTTRSPTSPAATWRRSPSHAARQVSRKAALPPALQHPRRRSHTRIRSKLNRVRVAQRSWMRGTGSRYVLGDDGRVGPAPHGTGFSTLLHLVASCTGVHAVRAVSAAAGIVLFIRRPSTGSLTYLGVTILGPDVEANCCCTGLMGATACPASGAGQAGAAGSGIVLHLASRDRAVALLTLLYLSAAVAPWMAGAAPTYSSGHAPSRPSAGTPAGACRRRALYRHAQRTWWLTSPPN